MNQALVDPALLPQLLAEPCARQSTQNRQELAEQSAVVDQLRWFLPRAYRRTVTRLSQS